MEKKTPASLFDFEMARAKPREIIRTDHTKLVTTAEFDSSEGKRLADKAGALLAKEYYGYGWITRAVGNPRDPIDRRGIAICLYELFLWFGTKAAMYLNPTDWNSPAEFEVKVKALGGELLERARLSREKRASDLPAVMDKGKVPDGFEQFIKAPKYRTVTNKDEAKKLILDHIKSEEKQAASVTDSRDVKDVA
jgi:hypothetical protein